MNPLQEIVIGVGIVMCSIALLLNFVIPWPYNIPISLGIFFLFPFITKRIVLGYAKKHGMLQHLPSKLEKTCLKCGWKTRKSICPRCESRQFHYT